MNCLFHGSKTDVLHELRSEHLSVTTENLKDRVDAHIGAKRRFTINESPSIPLSFTRFSQLNSGVD